MAGLSGLASRVPEQEWVEHDGNHRCGHELVADVGGQDLQLVGLADEDKGEFPDLPESDGHHQRRVQRAAE
jgi:hypothetical protein